MPTKRDIKPRVKFLHMNQISNSHLQELSETKHFMADEPIANVEQNLDIKNLVICINDSFTPGALALLNSITCHSTANYHVHFIYVRMREKNLGRIKQLSKTHQIHFSFYKIDKTLFNKLITIGHFRIENYFRLAIADILPVAIGKVLYLDCDMLALDSIEPLFVINLENKAVAIASNRNSGVLVMNLESWRSKSLGNRLIQHVREFPELCPLADNSAIINLLIPGDAIMFSDDWNRDAAIANDSSKIIHFVGVMKPWHYLYPDNKWKKLFFENLDQTFMNGWRPNFVHGILFYTRRALHKVKSINKRL